MTNFEVLKETLTRYGQEHLLRFWDELNDGERKQLISDIQELNLEEVQSFFKRATASLEESSAKLDDRLQPLPESTFLSISRSSKDQLKIYEEEGLSYSSSPMCNPDFRFNFQASSKFRIIMLVSYLWLGVKEPVWDSPTQKACTTSVFHHTNRCSVFKANE